MQEAGHPNPVLWNNPERSGEKGGGGHVGQVGGCREEETPGRASVGLGQGAEPRSSLCFSALSGWRLVVFGDLECCFQF